VTYIGWRGRGLAGHQTPRQLNNKRYFDSRWVLEFNFILGRVVPLVQGRGARGRAWVRNTVDRFRRFGHGNPWHGSVRGDDVRPGSRGTAVLGGRNPVEARPSAEFTAISYSQRSRPAMGSADPETAAG